MLYLAVRTGRMWDKYWVPGSLSPANVIMCQGFAWATLPRWLICYKDDHSQIISFEQNQLGLISAAHLLSPAWVVWISGPLIIQVACRCGVYLNGSLFLTWSPLAVDVAGGVAEGIARWRVCRICGGGSGPDQTVRPTAADHSAGDCQCHQRGRGPYPTAQVRATAGYATSFIVW